MHYRISNGNNQTFKALVQKTEPSSWPGKNRAQAEKIGLDKDTVTTNKQTSKKEITNKIKVPFKEEIESKGRDKSKVKFLLDGKKQLEPRIPTEIYEKPHMKRKVSTIFKARTRMLVVCSTSLMASLIRSLGGLSKCFYQGLWLAVLSADVIGQSINRRGVA